MEEKTIKSNELIQVLRTMNVDQCFKFFLSACENGYFELCQLCLDAGIDINIYHGIHEKTLLHTLISDGKFSAPITDWLIDKGADINASTVEGWTPLTTACYYGNLVAAKYFIDKGTKIRQYKDTKRIYRYKGDIETDLYCALNSPIKSSNREEIVKLLLEKGIDLDSEKENSLLNFDGQFSKK